MKCYDVEKQLLLQDSGELRTGNPAAVAAHLHNCEKCRNFQLSLTESRLAFAATQEPDVKIVQEILREARRNAPQRKPAPVFGLKPALAMAASVIIALGIFFSSFGPGKVGMELEVTDAQMMESEDQIVNVMYSGLSEDDLAFNFFMTFEEG